ncbi:MAG: TlpA disulfide reductase family protein [Saprospiraceae bacterium]
MGYPQESYYGAQVARRIEKIRLSAEGRRAFDFDCVDRNGKNISLSSIKGNFIILDFWASWGKPCRKSHPGLVQLYEKYHTKGLDIVSISSDKGNVHPWQRAIDEDNIGKWKLILAELCHTKDISYKYNVQFIPVRIVLDHNGNIIKRIDTASDEEFVTYIDGLFLSTQN